MLALPTDGRPEMVSRLKLVRLGEGVADDYFVIAPGLHHAAALEVKPAQERFAVVRYGDDLRGNGVRESGDVEARRGDHTRLRLLNAIDFRETQPQALRRALERSKDIGEAVVAVIGCLREPQGIESGSRHDEGRYPARDDQPDSQTLALHAPEITQELAV